MALFCIFLSACTGSFEPGALLNSPSNSDKPATIDSVTIKDKSLVIKGKQLNSVKKISIEGVSQTFQIDSQTTEEIQTSVPSSLQLIAYKSYKLILSTASAETIAAVALITLTLDTFGASEGQVLKFNSTTQAWGPGDFNGLHFIGSWDPSANSNPYIISGGYGDSSSPKAGDYYIVSTLATTTAIDTHTDWNVGDWIVFGSDNKWHKLASDGGVKSFKGRTGAVTPQSGDYNLSQLGDIDLSGITSNSILKWNSTSSKWVVGADNTSGAGGVISGSSVSVNNAGGTGGFSTSATSTDLEGNADLILRSDSDAAAGGDVVFKRGATESMRLTSTGLGVGTAAPQNKLDVNGGILAYGILNSPRPNSVSLSQEGGTSRLMAFGADTSTKGEMAFYTGTSDGASQTMAMSIKPDGKIGVGVLSPTAKLHSFDGSVSNFTDGLVYVDNRSSGTDTALKIGDSSQNSSRYLIRAITDSDGDGGGPYDVLAVKSNGNVGIGTTTPSSKLEVVGVNTIFRGTDSSFFESEIDVYSSAAEWHQPYLTLRRARGTQASPTYPLIGDNLGKLTFRNHLNTDGAGILAWANENQSAIAAGSGLSFFTIPNGTVSGVERMNISASGNVGIGTTSPGSTLQVNGSFGTNLVTKTVNYTLTATDSVVLANSSSGAITMTLPTAVGITGRQYTIKKVDSSSNMVTIATTNSETIDGSSNMNLKSRWSFLIIISDGSNWNVIGQNTQVRIQLQGSARRWSDGSYAISCNTYRNPPTADYLYVGDVGDGIYTIDPDGSGGNAPFEVYCDMTTNNGGWTLVATRSLTGLGTTVDSEVEYSTNLTDPITDSNNLYKSDWSNLNFTTLKYELNNYSSKFYFDNLSANEKSYAKTAVFTSAQSQTYRPNCSTDINGGGSTYTNCGGTDNGMLGWVRDPNGGYCWWAYTTTHSGAGACNNANGGTKGRIWVR